MTNFEEKFLDGPNVGYCSSSDDEHTVPKKDQVSSKNSSKYQKTERTGPKGVLADYQLSEQEKFIEQRAKEAAVIFLFYLVFDWVWKWELYVSWLCGS